MYYGHYDILKAYTKSFLPFKINGELQHGWAAKSGITSADLNSQIEKLKLKRYYVYNTRNRELAIEKGYNNVVAIGAPFIYINNIEKYYSKQKSKSLIVFPTHTHEFMEKVDVSKCYKNYINDLMEISDYFKNITVSLFWKEFKNKDIINLFNESGISVTTMGPRDKNPKFLINFIKEVSKYEYVSSDNFSSAIFYSLFMKKKVFIYSDAIKDSGIFNFSSYNFCLNYFSKIYPQLMWENFDHVNHIQIAEQELGHDNKISPKVMRKVFGWS